MAGYLAKQIHFSGELKENTDLYYAIEIYLCNRCKQTRAAYVHR